MFLLRECLSTLRERKSHKNRAGHFFLAAQKHFTQSGTRTAALFSSVNSVLHWQHFCIFVKVNNLVKLPSNRVHAFIFDEPFVRTWPHLHAFCERAPFLFFFHIRIGNLTPHHQAVSCLKLNEYASFGSGVRSSFCICFLGAGDFIFAAKS